MIDSGTKPVSQDLTCMSLAVAEVPRVGHSDRACLLELPHLLPSDPRAAAAPPGATGFRGQIVVGAGEGPSRSHLSLPFSNSVAV